jgi:hypothetical protein
VGKVGSHLVAQEMRLADPKGTVSAPSPSWSRRLHQESCNQVRAMRVPE